MNHTPRSPVPACLSLVLLVACGTGCTSVLTSASLRDLVWDGDEHAAEAASDASDDEPADPAAAGTDGDPLDTMAEADTEADAQRREAAIEEAVTRLAKVGHLDDAARATLMATLDRTQQEDWPAVIEAFAETLAATRPPAVVAAEPDAVTTAADSASPAATEAETDAHVVAKADLDAAVAAAAPEPAAVPPEEPARSAADKPASSPTEPAPAPVVADETEPPPAEQPAPPGPPLAIQNACFATRVQAWGVVDRFPADRFRPGQEVIVYFELDGLSAGESPAGHTTCIDATLRLVAADGRTIHDWSFEPIAETCRARRHDYFARYVVRLPEAAPVGACRIECDVTDTLSGQVATTSLPLDIVAVDPGN